MATRPLFVRIPVAEAEKLDRAAFELKTPKQELVRDLLSGADFGFTDRRRVIVETEGDSLTVGRHSFRPTEGGEVLTLSQAGELLQVEETALEKLAEAGEVPGRKVGDEWRFARSALIEWLAAGEDE
jgi:excisionase family DNA binding protein